MPKLLVPALALVVAVVGVACSADETTDPITGLASITTTPAAAPTDTDPVATTQPAAVTDTTPAATTTTTEVSRTDGILTVGALLPQTGGQSFIGAPILEAARMAATDINSAGGVLGQPLQLVAADTATDADTARAGLATLLDGQGAEAILGPVADLITRELFDPIVQTPAVNCSASNTGADLSVRDDGGMFFRTVPSDRLQGRALARTLITSGAGRVAVVGAADEFGVNVSQALSDDLTEAGVEIVSSALYPPGTSDFAPVVAAVIDAAPDAVALLAGDEGVLVLQAMIAAGVTPATLPIHVTDQMPVTLLGDLVDETNPGVVSGIVGTRLKVEPTGGAAFFADAFSTFAPQSDTLFAPEAYDCMVTIALAATAAGSTDPVAIAGQLTAVTSGGTACDDYATCLALIADGADIDYVGATGLDLDERGDPVSGTYESFGYDPDGTQTVTGEITATS